VTAQQDRESVPCYVARCKCGCGHLIYASVDDGTTPKETARSVAQMIRKGYHIERMTVGEVRRSTFAACPNKARTQELLVLEGW
jgi:hypothetical protein